MRVNLGVKKAARCAWAALVFSRCAYLFVTILTSPTTSGRSFVRRRTIIRIKTLSMACKKFNASFLSQKESRPWLGGSLSLSRCVYFTLTAAIPTTIWSLRIRTEIITIRMKDDRKVFIGFECFVRL